MSGWIAESIRTIFMKKIFMIWELTFISNFYSYSSSQGNLVDVSFTLLTKPLLPTESLKLKEDLSMLVQNTTLFKNISLSNGNLTSSALNDLNATLSGRFLILFLV
jgi:hypothetical protein